jgi:Flp pilus assembly protein TadG
VLSTLAKAAAADSVSHWLTSGYGDLNTGNAVASDQGIGETMNRYLRQRLLARLRNRDGATMLEAALITPLLLLLTFAIMEFASILYCHLALQNGAAQATRFAVTGNVSGTMNRVDSIKDAFRRATPTVAVPDSGFTFSHLAVGGGAFTPGTGGPNEVERLSVDFTWSLMTPLLRPFFTNGEIHLHAESTMKNESDPR